MVKYKIVIVGAGFAGAILARQLRKYTDAEIIVLEKGKNLEHSETGTGLNINSNAMASLQSLDPALTKRMRRYGLPRARMRAETMAGNVVYNEAIYEQHGQNLASTTGLRIRWADAYAAVREGIEILYGHEFLGQSVTPENQLFKVKVLNNKTGAHNVIKDVCLLIGADGRYSKVRDALEKPKTTFIGVCNFRLLVPDTSGDLFDDMELIYNIFPKKESDCKQFQHCLMSLPRIGIMKMPAARNSPQNLYIFGNFGTPEQIPEMAKTEKGLLDLYRPQKGPVSHKGQFILEILENFAPFLHWARMQYTNPLFTNSNGNILLLGDAAHAIVPTLGQGATLAIEDACVASEVLINAIQNNDVSPDIMAEIERKRLERRLFVSRVSVKASQHLMKQALPQKDIMRQEQQQWQDESKGFRESMRQVWCGHPLVFQRTNRAQEIL